MIHRRTLLAGISAVALAPVAVAQSWKAHIRSWSLPWCRPRTRPV